jgi:hypothetical protein
MASFEAPLRAATCRTSAQVTFGSTPATFGFY